MPKSSREIFKLLEKDGWYLARTKGDHWQLKHPVKDLHINNIKSIEKQAGIKIL